MRDRPYKADDQRFGVALALILSLAPGGTWAQQPAGQEVDAGPIAGSGAADGTPSTSAVSVSADKSEARIGEPIELTIEVRGQPGVLYRLPPSLKLGSFSELARSEDAGSGSIQRLRLKVATFEETGDLQIPSFVLEGTAADAGSAPLEVPAVKVKVLSMLQGIEKPTPRDLAPPVPVFVKDYRSLVYLGLLLFWAALALAIRFRRKPLPSPSRLNELPPPRLAHEIALEKLKALVQDDLLRQGKFQEYFVRVSETIREYVGNRYSFFALDLTTRELIEELRDRFTPGLDPLMLRGLLENADLVKFAKLSPTDEMCSWALNGAYSLVEATRFIPEPLQETG